MELLEMVLRNPILPQQASSNLFTQPGTYTISLYATKGTCMASKQRVIKLDIPSVLEIPKRVYS